MFKRIAVSFQTARFSLEIGFAYRSWSYNGLTSIPASVLKKILLLLSGVLVIALAMYSFFASETGKSVSNASESVVAEAGKKADPLPLPSEKVIIAGKKERKLIVATLFSDGEYEKISEFPIAIGEKEGRKEKQGDLKTPEGLYWIVDRMEDEELPPIYGIRSFVLNYPNETDRSEGRGGNGIWIHGCEHNGQPEKSRGCLALSNENVDKLTPHLQIGRAVLILPTIKKMDATIKETLRWDALQKEKKQILEKSQARDAFVMAFLERWRAAWEAKDIETYTALYSRKFAQNGMNYSDWKLFKTGIFARPETLNIELSDVNLVKLGSNFALITFTQVYSAGAYLSVEKKQLKLFKTGNDWKITEEIILPSAAG